MIEEMKSLHNNEMWNLVELPSGRNHVSRNSKSKDLVQMGKETKNLVFELRNEEDDSDELTKLDEEVEYSKLVVRWYKRLRKLAARYSFPNFHSTFELHAIDEEPKSVREEMDLIEDKL